MNGLLCIGHRGAGGHAPENTLASFHKALELGAHCVELDVYLVEGRLVVIHDEHLERTTNGHGPVMGQTFEYLRSLDAGGGERIPTLEEVCDAVAGRAGVNIELKGPGTAAPVVEYARSLCAGRWRPDQILVSSFDREQLEVCRALDRDLKLGVLCGGSVGDDLEFAIERGAFALHPALRTVDQAVVDAAQRQGLRVFVYTVNHAADLRRMVHLGVDGVFTDYPDRVPRGGCPEPQAIGWR